jgi:chromosome segregation ATPase
LADIAARMGGKNEELRNLLIDAHRRICALDDLRDVFRNLAEPMGSALQALEQEKADNVTLRNSLVELRAAHESVCSEFSALEKRAAELESAGEELRRQLALAQEATCGRERDKTELTSEIVALREEATNLKSQLAHGAAHSGPLSEANQILVDHANSANKRIVELQSEGALMRQKLVSLENEKRSLQTALDQTLAERSRLSRRLIESENALTASRARLEQIDISLAAAENERATLTTERDEANERHQSEAYALNLQLEALSSRAATAEKLLSQARQTLDTRTEVVRSLERKVVEATNARDVTEEVVERLTAARDALDGKTRELEQERASLMERYNSLAETLKARETSLTHAGEKIKSLTDRIAEIEGNAGSYRAKTDRRIDELNASLQRERVELAVAQGTLETARRDYARLQRDMLPGREAPRRKRSPRLKEVSKEPSKSTKGSGDGRGPRSVEAEPEVSGAAESSSTR